jgi:hypothetical protein
MTPSSPLLIVHPGALGDLVCLFPIIAALRRRFHPVGLLCQGPLGRLAAAERLVEAWYPLEAAWTASLFTAHPNPEARRRLADYASILCVSAHPALDASLAAIGGARRCRVAPRPPAREPVHVSDHLRRAIVSCGWLDAVEEGAASLPWQAAGGPVLMHPGAGSPRKRWPLGRFLALADRLRGAGRQVDFIVGPAEEDLLPELENRGERAGRPRDLAELAGRLRSTSAFIGNDSGVSHLAGWVGVPSVVIFGPSDPMRWRPCGRSVEVLRPPVACKPCFETEAQKCDAAECLNATRVEDVLQALARVYPPLPETTRPSDGNRTQAEGA